MNREQLAHILRAAATIVDDPNILDIGSQSVLATFDEEELPDGECGHLNWPHFGHLS